MATFQKLKKGEMNWSSAVREWLKEHENPDICIYCGSRDSLTTEHILPISRGGEDIPDNVVRVCKHCNSSIGMGPGLPSYSLDVSGDIHCSGIYRGSDSTLKRDIKNLTPDRIPGLYNLDAKTFKLKALNQIPGYKASFAKNDSSSANLKNLTDNLDTGKVRIGLIAEQVKPLFPELISEDSTGILSVDYEGLIPVIIEALKAENQDIRQLRSDLAQLTGTQKKAEEPVSSNNSDAWLGKNKPNPFNENTTIDFYLPQSVQKATFYIYDLQGKQIKSFPVVQRENASIIIQASELLPGMYYYSLIADGNIVGTEKMILTD